MYDGAEAAPARLTLLRMKVRRECGEELNLEAMSKEGSAFINLDFTVGFKHQLMRALFAEVKKARKRKSVRRRRHAKRFRETVGSLERDGDDKEEVIVVQDD